MSDPDRMPGGIFYRPPGYDERIVSYGPTDPQAYFAMHHLSLDGIDTTHMPTAIVIIYTNDGFVVASDGYGDRYQGPPALMEQKIFEIKDPAFSLVYGVSGAASFLVKDPYTGIENDVFKRNYEQAIAELKNWTWSDLRDYVNEFVRLVGPTLGKEFSARDSRTQEMEVQFAGYFKGEPAMAERNIFYSRDGYSVKEERSWCPPGPTERSIVGSPHVTRGLLSAEDDAFSRFKTVGWKKVYDCDWNLSFEEAVESATQYIEACKSPEAREIDSKCKAIGGFTWVAKVTKANGFEWLKHPD